MAERVEVVEAVEGGVDVGLGDELVVDGGVPFVEQQDIVASCCRLDPPLGYIPPGGMLSRTDDHRAKGSGEPMNALLHMLRTAGSMTWEITWALILGFLLSAIVQALVSK